MLLFVFCCWLVIVGSFLGFFFQMSVPERREYVKSFRVR